MFQFSCSILKRSIFHFLWAKRFANYGAVFVSEYEKQLHSFGSSNKLSLFNDDINFTSLSKRAILSPVRICIFVLFCSGQISFRRRIFYIFEGKAFLRVRESETLPFISVIQGQAWPWNIGLRKQQRTERERERGRKKERSWMKRKEDRKWNTKGDIRINMEVNKTDLIKE